MEPGDRRASIVGSYPSADIDTTQVFSFSGRRLFERRKCDSDSQDVHGAEKLYRSTALGINAIMFYLLEASFLLAAQEYLDKICIYP